MKKNVLILGAVTFVGLSVFGQDVKQIPNFTSEAEKAAWIQAHPTDYERLSGEKVTNTVPEFKTQAEKEAWLQTQHTATIAVPEFKTQAEKDAYFTKDKVSEVVKVDFTTEAEKDAWLRANAGVINVTQEEFNALPADKQAAMLSDKNYVIIK